MRPQYGYALLAYVYHLSQNSKPDARGHCPLQTGTSLGELPRFPTPGDSFN